MDWTQTARQQSGVIHRQQLLESGLTEHQVQWLVRTRRLIAVHTGVYVHASLRPGLPQRLWAAAIWSGGVLSHRSAAEVLGLNDLLAAAADPLRIHLTVSDKRYRALQPGLRLHRVPLDQHEVVRVARLPVTSTVRTVIDLLRTEPSRSTMAILDRALFLRLVTPADIRAGMRATPGRTGNARLQQSLGKLELGAHAESERLLHRLLRSAGITDWTAQLAVRLREGQQVVHLDVGFEQLRLGLEVDGRRYHDEDSHRFESDRLRQNELAAEGWTLMRITWRQLADNPVRVLESIRRAIAIRPVSATGPVSAIGPVSAVGPAGPPGSQPG